MKADKENDKDMVKRIKKCKCYYEMLGVPRDATESKIQKAYQKLALKLHPDNNKAPGSADAFKSLENAVSILTDGQKRKDYDLVGDVNLYEKSCGRNSKKNTKLKSLGVVKKHLWIIGAYSRDPSIGFPLYQIRCRIAKTIAGIMPIVLIMVFAIPLLSSLFTSDLPYSLQRPSKYLERRTVNLKIPYYVKESFLSEYQGSLNQLEYSVEEDYKQHMKQSCYQERENRKDMMNQAKNATQHDKARQLKMPSCDELDRFGSD